MTQAVFIAGTDTDVGKTYVTVALLHALRAAGGRVFALKPLASGAVDHGQGLRNEDALALMAASNVPLPYAQVNPVCLPEALAPHIAAQRAGKRLRRSQLTGWVRGALMTPADLALVEGAGGWRTPLSGRDYLSGVVQDLGLPVILVVGMRLGCINHALLSAEAIAHDGLKLLAWVANFGPQRMNAWEENLATLQEMMPAPCLGAIDSAGALLMPWQLELLPAFDKISVSTRTE